MKDYLGNELSKKKIGLLVFISIFLIALASFLFYLLLSTFVFSKFNTQFDYQVKTVDSYISRGYYEKALESLIFIKDVPEEESYYLRLLKRYYIISKAVNNYEDLKKFTEQSLKIFPDDAKIKSIYVYTLLKLNLDTRAYNSAKKYIDDKNFIKNLYAEAVIKSNRVDQVNKDLPFLTNMLINLKSNENPQDYVMLYENYKHQGAIINAVLYFLKKGDLSSAQTYFEKYINQQRPLLGAYLFYDLEEYDKALDYSTLVNFSQPENDWTLFIADIYISLGEKAKAAEIYANFLKDNPKYSFIPYYNLLFLDSSQGNIDILQNGIETFPKVAELNLALSDAYVSLGQVDKAKEVLEKFLTFEPDNIEAVLQYNFLNSYTSPERYIGVLWDLYNKNIGQNERIPISLLWYLSGFGDTQEMNKVLKSCEEHYGPIYWVLYYQAIVAVLEENYKSAYDLFKKTHDEIAAGRNNFFITYEALYNCALLSNNFGDYEQAYKEISRASELYHGSDEKVLCRIRTLLGKVFLGKKEIEKAIREFNYAVDLDPSNIEASYFLNVCKNGGLK